jgi:hypothetical protein
MAQSDDDLLAKVMAFLERETGVRRTKLSPRSDIARDLGVDGSDGVELMRKFAEEFRVDMVGFRSSDHFGPEAGFVPLAIFFPSWWRSRRTLRPLLLEDLVGAARRGRWSGDQASDGLSRTHGDL